MTATDSCHESLIIDFFEFFFDFFEESRDRDFELSSYRTIETSRNRNLENSMPRKIEISKNRPGSHLRQAKQN